MPLLPGMAFPFSLSLLCVLLQNLLGMILFAEDDTPAGDGFSFLFLPRSVLSDHRGTWSIICRYCSCISQICWGSSWNLIHNFSTVVFSVFLQLPLEIRSSWNLDPFIIWSCDKLLFALLPYFWPILSTLCFCTILATGNKL